MFRKRFAHKPSEDLLSNFKRQYTDLLPSQDQVIETITLQAGQTPNLDFDPSHFQGISGRNNGLYTSASLEVPPEWRTSGLLDPNTDGFHDLNQPGGYWPPTPQGSSLYGGGPSDIPTHQATYGMATPASASSAHHIGFTPQATHFHGHEFISTHRLESIGANPSFNGSQGLAPQTLHQPTHTIVPSETHVHGLRLGDVNLSQRFESSQLSSSLRAEQATSETIGPSFVIDEFNQFRFRTILKAQTAMLKHHRDIPVTYLNKSQTYNIQIQDSSIPPGHANPNLRYRTAVRISFEDEQQRKSPNTSWQLWNEGRGSNEAIKRGGRKPKAVEFVSQDQTHPEQRNRLQLNVEHFDGFSVNWSPNTDNIATCNLQLRFNFLSTDFSHSKGVKGVPVRLCAKTEIIEGQTTLPPSPTNREICYCAVKIFRDHGAERKLANDKNHIDKLIDKFTAQAEQAEVSAKESGKRRRRSDSMISGRPTKIAKHKRAWSMSSSGSLEDAPETAEDELSVRIRSLKSMPGSVRPVSAFYFKGDEQDDLDSHPVILSSNSPTSGSPVQSGSPSLKTGTTQTTNRSAGMHSETPTSRSPSMMRGRSDPMVGSSSDATTTPVPLHQSPVKPEHLMASPRRQLSPPSSASMRLKRLEKPAASSPITHVSSALDVDQNYQAPPERKARAVAEFFMKPSLAWEPPKDDNYRAIYLMERTLKELVRVIAVKCGVEATSIICTVRVNEQGLRITAEDDMVEQMPERQGFIAELDIANDTHDSAAQFFESQDELATEADSGTQFKLTLRY